MNPKLISSADAATTHGSYEIGPKYEALPALAKVPTIQAYFKANGYYTLAGGKVLHHGFQGRLARDIDRPLTRQRRARPKSRLNWNFPPRKHWGHLITLADATDCSFPYCAAM